ncbi:MAG: hydroxyacid dehydrogenase [Phycisphaerae bacterium]
MTSTAAKILIAEPFDPSVVNRLRTVGEVVQLADCDELNLLAEVADCDALLVRTRTRVTREVIERARRLKVIGRGGVGLENIDLDAARSREVTVVYTPAAATDAVADLTVGMMLSLVRKLRRADEGIRAGSFTTDREDCIGPELSELTLGIVGLGRIGRAVARRCHHGFRMKIVYNDIVEPGLTDFVAVSAQKDELYRTADVVSLHVPLTDKTRHLINESSLATFKRGAFLINTSRGAVVDEAAVARALEEGHLAGAAFDVFDPEPPQEYSPLLRAPNTLLTPHIGARTPTGLARMNNVLDDVIAVLTGKPPRFPAWT